MTVKELIEELNKYDEQKEVLMLVSYDANDDVCTKVLDNIREMHDKILIGELK